MLVRSDSLAAMAIVSIQTGSRLASIGEAIIDPRNLKVVALYCDGPALDVHPAVLHTEDIREVSDIGAIIDNTDDIMPLDDLVRLKEVTDLSFELLDKQVV